MTNLDKCIALKDKGYTYNPITGEILGMYGKVITRKLKEGYIQINGRGTFEGHLSGHSFAWYMYYGNLDFIVLDHINRIPDDNRIENLRSVTPQQNNFNKNVKGYCWSTQAKKWLSRIGLNNKVIHLGLFNTEEKAREAYLNAKKIYHIIN